MSQAVINCLCSQRYPDQSLLLLLTGALCWRIIDSALSPALPVLNTFKVFSSPYPQLSFKGTLGFTGEISLKLLFYCYCSTVQLLDLLGGLETNGKSNLPIHMMINTGRLSHEQ